MGKPFGGHKMRGRKAEVVMGKTNGSKARSDALVLFGVTGDLAFGSRATPP